jgi:hypothetical protein
MALIDCDPLKYGNVGRELCAFNQPAHAGRSPGRWREVALSDNASGERGVLTPWFCRASTDFRGDRRRDQRMDDMVQSSWAPAKRWETSGRRGWQGRETLP